MQSEEGSFRRGELAIKLANSKPFGSDLSVFSYYYEAVSIGNSLPNDSLTAVGTFLAGRLHSFQGKKDSAYILLRRALLLAKGQKNLARYEIESRRLLALIFKDWGEGTNAIFEAGNALKLAQQVKDTSLMAACYNTLGIIYGLRGFPLEVAHNYVKAAQLYKALGNRRGQAGIYNNLAIEYGVSGRTDSSFFYWYKAWKIAPRETDPREEIMLYQTKGELFNYSKEPDSALFYLLRVEKQIQEDLNLGFRVETYLQICLAYIAKKDFKNALKFAQIALPLSQEADLKYQTLKFYKLIAESYFALGNPNEGYQYLQKHIGLQELVEKASAIKTNEEFNTRFKIHESELDLERNRALSRISQIELRQSRNLNIFVIAMLLLSISGGALSFWLYRRSEAQKVLLAEKTEEIERRRQELTELNNTKDKLFSIIAHDLRGPIGSLKAAPDVLEFLIKREEFDTVNQFSGTLRQAVGQVYDLLDSLLLWAQTQRGDLEVNLREVPVVVLLDKIIKLYEPVAAKKELTLKQEVNPKELIAIVDENSILTILRNLLNNAIKFSPKGREIILSARLHSNDGIELTVQDFGTGMNEDQIEKLFQADKTKTRVGTGGEKGSGLGMILVKELISLNNYQFNIQSKLGEGTTVAITIPPSKTGKLT